MKAISVRMSRAALSPTSLALLVVFAVTIVLRCLVIGSGAPHITVDDDTAFEGGFLVWFGHAPPQRMYIESWVYGLVCIVVYLTKVALGLVDTGIGLNVVADAYRDFYGDPGAYVLAYRWITLAVDLITLWFVYRIARQVLEHRWSGWASVVVVAMYALSYNVIWSGIVARPDSFLSFYCAAGLLSYLRSEAGRHYGWLMVSAVLLGVAAGQKLHGAFLAIFLAIDLLRVHGLREGFGRFVLLAGVSFFLFCVSAGSPLFDPLLYLKLRMANYKDDISPWLEWGDQFITILRGTGWIAVPVIVAGCWVGFRDRALASSKIKTIAVVAVGWLLLFSLIRQMRAYWMLPALPVFYVMAAYALSSVRNRSWTIVAAGLLLAVLGAQSIRQVLFLRAAPYTELVEWVSENASDHAIYVLGFDAITLPKNTRCIERTRAVVERLLESDRREGLTFTERHVKNWEERTTLVLFDMLENRFESGFEFYDVYTTPPETFGSVVGWDDIKFILVQDDFNMDEAPAVRNLLDAHFELSGKKTGAGGGDYGLKYKIYARK
jgi:hypothetical protein